jgi:hypothetical protein
MPNPDLLAGSEATAAGRVLDVLKSEHKRPKGSVYKARH